MAKGTAERTAHYASLRNSSTGEVTVALTRGARLPIMLIASPDTVTDTSLSIIWASTSTLVRPEPPVEAAYSAPSASAAARAAGAWAPVRRLPGGGHRDLVAVPGQGDLDGDQDDEQKQREEDQELERRGSGLLAGLLTQAT